MDEKLEWLFNGRSWFAWRPVRLESGKWAWLRFVERRHYPSFGRYDGGGETRYVLPMSATQSD